MHIPAIDQWHRDVPHHTRWPTILGVAVLAAWGCGFGVWAATAPLDGAVVASGAFVATGENKPVQHLEGGIIRKLLVREGQLVEQDQSLLRMDETAATAKLHRLNLRRYRLLMMQARLEAELLSRETVVLPTALVAQADDPDIQSLLERQKVELQVRHARQRDEEQVLRQEIAGLSERVTGYSTQLRTMQERLTLFGDELKDKKGLMDRQLARKTDVMAIQRAEAGVAGEIGDLTGRIADSRERIARAERQIAQIRSAATQKVVEELRTTETDLDDIQEQIRAARDVVDRVDVRAPVRGVVIKLHHHVPGAVVGPGAVILELLPIGEELIIEARVNPGDIAHLHAGQEALIRLTAYNQRITPMIGGTLIYVSADTVVENDARREQEIARSRRQSYVARIRLDERDARSKIADFRPLPGMPADVYVKTGERTFFNYMMRPLLDSFSRAFREQ